MHFGYVELDTTSSTGSTRQTCRVVSRRDEPRGIWAYVHNIVYSPYSEASKKHRKTEVPYRQAYKMKEIVCVEFCKTLH